MDMAVDVIRIARAERALAQETEALDLKPQVPRLAAQPCKKRL